MSLAVHNPATGVVIEHAPIASAADCETAVRAAHNALPDLTALTSRGRAEVLRRAYELLMDERRTFASLITAENGKPIREAEAEVSYGAEFFRWFSEETTRIGGEFRTSPAGDKRILTYRAPIGVALLITPWNFPMAMAARKIAPAFAAGCSVIIKPAPETPLTAFALARLLARAGAPPGSVNVVLPDPPADAVAAMLAMPEVRKLSFTGSTGVGRALMRVAADRVVSVSLELGGNAPFLVCHDADLEVALAAAVVAKMRNGGAACVAANRFLVDRDLGRAFTEGLVERMGALRVGDPTDPRCDVGPLVSESERAKVERLVDGAVSRGAAVHRCGEPFPGPGPFYPPTVLVVDATDPILGSEIFGPVAVVATYDDEAKMIAAANDTDAGLRAYVMSEDLRRAITIAERLEVGMVGINRGLVSDPAAPFGGVKASGLGREGGREGIDAYLETKYIALDL
jgi:succinate-semialdehyde dehydrogenase/glutarate-semialdehyde dehydrogenase